MEYLNLENYLILWSNKLNMVLSLLVVVLKSFKQISDLGLLRKVRKLKLGLLLAKMKPCTDIRPHTIYSAMRSHLKYTGYNVCNMIRMSCVH